MTRVLIILAAVIALAVSAAPASGSTVKLGKPKTTLVESGSVMAHRAQGEDSRGLWRL
jgi:hypothetical protein